MSFPKHQDPNGPCEKYAGNVCSGFGGRCVCWHCGWDRLYHSKDLRETIQKALKEAGIDDQQ